MQHPIHPALVHFPIACWVLTAPCEIAGYLSGNANWWALAYILLLAGIVLALPAMLAGMYDFSKLQQSKPVLNTAYRHMVIVGSAWCSYLISLVLRPSLSKWDTTQLPGATALFFEGLGFLLLIVGAWYGAQLVYRFHAGMQQEND